MEFIITMDHSHHNNHSEENQMIYTCPMHLEIRQDRPGMCPECGMNLILAKSEKRKVKSGSHESHEADKHRGHSTEMFFRKFWVSLILTVPYYSTRISFKKYSSGLHPNFLDRKICP